MNTRPSMSKYNFLEREGYWQRFWLENKVYRFDPDSPREVYSIDTPPPTVSGKLHMGHVFSYTQTEVIARYRRMAGYSVYYPFGMDDNGLPTERLVEQELGIKGRETNRNEFINKCLEVVKKYHRQYRELWQALGLSVDWDLEYSTISKEVRLLTQRNFLDLYKRGVIYRQKAPSLWCVTCQTSVAQAEVDYLVKESVLYHISFSDLENHEVIIATSRPELLPACVAVIVNPKDLKNKKLVGSKVKTPLGVEVPVYADNKAELAKGTGVVMCCTYGDETDLAWKKQFNLDEKLTLNKDGRFNESCLVKQMVGKNVTEGRLSIVDLLKEKGFIKKETPISHEVGCHERCSSPIEIINSDQWFVKILDIKKELMKLGDQINWYPQSMKQRYLNWVENLKWDWCISRDRFYGISVPAFYCSKCHKLVLPEESELPIDPLLEKTKSTCVKCGNETLVGESLVLDTWFTSSNSPEINASLNKDLTKDKVKVPMSLRPQAHDIIRTWTFYTIVLAYYKYGQIPWRDIAISGHILLREGEKISKRTGGGRLRPEEQIAQYSADAIRYAMCNASLGRDAFYEINEVENGKKLINKLYNAANFCFSALRGYKESAFDFSKLEEIDKWILSESLRVAKLMAKSFDRYDYSHARNLFLTFFWDKFCDNYLEIVKKRIYDLDDTSPQKFSAQTALFNTLINILKMAAPFVPHITEELYQSFYVTKLENLPKSIHLDCWPNGEVKVSQKTQKIVAELLEIISLVRKEKGQRQLNLASEVKGVTICHPWIVASDLDSFLYDLKGVTKAGNIAIKNSKDVKVILNT